MKPEFRFSYSSDSHDEVLMEFLKSYAKRKGQSTKELILETLKNYWLSIALQEYEQMDIESLELQDSAWKSIGALSSQIRLIVSQLNLEIEVTDFLSNNAVEKTELSSTSAEERDDYDPMDF